MTILIIIALLVVLLAGWVMSTQRRLVVMDENINNAMSQIGVQLSSRFDALTALLDLAKGYAAHESGTLEEVTKARTAVMNAPTPEGKMQADGFLTGALKNLFAVAEAYPDLKANTNFQQLQAELSNTEDKISYMRQSFNDTVMKYNTAIQTFPAVLIAGMMGFKQRDSFDATAGAEVAPKVQF